MREIERRMATCRSDQRNEGSDEATHLSERRTLTGSSEPRRFDREFGQPELLIERGESFKKM
jgi:hypothetical protein